MPENRQEITTEGGLDVAGQLPSLRSTVGALQAAGSKVSMFIDPEPEQVRASVELGAEMIELHTGCFANSQDEVRAMELRRLSIAAELGHELGLQVNAGHGINYRNLAELFVVPHLVELNIGHSIVSRAVSVGLESAVREMRDLMNGYDAAAS